MTITAGIDVGTGAVKAALFEITDDKPKWLARQSLRIRQRNPLKLARQVLDDCLDKANVNLDDIAYIATTGEGESVPFHTGHFYSMTTHGRGGLFFDADAIAVLDAGALHGRAIRVDPRGKVLTYKMTSQCASGSGQFLENIARYLGIAQDEIGPLSLEADDPEAVSGICAVLAETDVINMVSRGISASNILKGIHLSMAGRLARLLKTVGAKDGKVMMTGGLAGDAGLLATIQEELDSQKSNARITAHEHSIFAGAIGAALWGAFRYDKLKQLDALPKAS